MSQIFTNSARTTLLAAIDNTQTTLQVSSLSGFPVLSGADFFYATLYRGAVGAETDVEIVKVTATAATTFTIVRNQEETTAQNYVALGGVIYVDLRMTAAGATAMVQKANNLSDLANTTTARNNLGVAIGTNVQAQSANLDWIAVNVTAAGKALLDDADATAQRTTLGLGNAATKNTGTSAGTVATGDHNHTGTYQPLDATLTALAGVTIVDNSLLRGTGTDAFETVQLSDFGATLIDDGDAAGARSTLGLNNVDNTSDANKPVSTAQQAALDGKQAYDAATAKLDEAQTFTAPQKTTVAASSASLTVDLAAILDAIRTPTAGGALTFTNITAGVGFEILFVNDASYAITNGGNIKCVSTLFNTISATGRYRLTGKCFDGTNVDLDVSGAHV